MPRLVVMTTRGRKCVGVLRRQARCDLNEDPRTQFWSGGVASERAPGPADLRSQDDVCACKTRIDLAWWTCEVCAPLLALATDRFED